LRSQTLSRARKVAWFTVAVDLLGLGLILPMKPFYAESFGASAVAVTWLTATFAFAQLVFAPLWGRLGDRVGRRPVLVWASLVSALGYAAFAAADTLLVLFLARSISGAGSATIPTAQAIVADATAPNDRARVMGWLGGAFGVGFVLGPLLGGALVKLSVAAPPLCAMALALVNLALAWRWLPETRPRPTQPTLNATSPSKPRSGVRARWWGLLGLVCAVKLAMAIMEQTVGLFIEQRYLGPGELQAASARTALVLAMVGAMAVAVQMLGVGRVVARYGERGAVARGAMVAGVAMALVPLAPQVGFGLFVVLMVSQAIGTSLMLPAVMALVSRTGADGSTGKRLGAAQAASAMGRLLGPVVAGPLFVVSPDVPWTAAALLLLAVAVASAGPWHRPVWGSQSLEAANERPELCAKRL